MKKRPDLQEMQRLAETADERIRGYIREWFADPAFREAIRKSSAEIRERLQAVGRDIAARYPKTLDRLKD